jgi:hypothetical protein
MGELSREFRAELKKSSRYRMLHTNHMGMKCLAVKGLKSRARVFVEQG